MMTFELGLLLVLFQVKHLLADYFLQSGFMLKKFDKDPEKWVPALAAHCGVHVAFTLTLVLGFTLNPLLAIGLSILDFVLHFCMDRVKASPSLMGRWKPLYGSTFTMYVNMAQGKDSSGVRFQTMPEEQLDALKKVGRAALRENTFFWWALGIDQTFHHLTHYLIIALMLR